MSEDVEISISDADRKISGNRGLETLENERSPEQKSPIDDFLSTVRARQGESGYKNRARAGADLIDFFKSAIEDKIAEKGPKSKEVDRLRNTPGVAADIVATGSTIDDDVRELINEEIDKQLTDWKTRADLLEDDIEHVEERREALENLHIFEAFQQVLNTTPQDQWKEQQIAVPEVKEPKARDNQAELPEYKYEPKKSDEFLDEQGADAIKLKTMETFMVKAREDLYAQAKDAEPESPDLMKAVESAIEYFGKNKESSEDIVAIVQNGEVIYAGSAQNEPKKDGQRYLFKPKVGLNDPFSLLRYAERFHTYEERAGDLDRGIKALSKLQETDGQLKDREGAEDRLAISRIIQQYRRYLRSVYSDGMPEDKLDMLKKKWDILDRFNDLIDERTPEDQRGPFSNEDRIAPWQVKDN